MEHILDKLDRGSREAPGDLNDVLIPLIQDAIEEARDMCMGLRPSILDDLGIIATINWFCREFHSAHPDINVRHTIDIEESEIPDALKIVFFRVLQEGLSNVAEHSQADHVDVHLLKKNASVEFAVQDNGIGFQLDEPGSVDDADPGMGLSSMKERVELVGGCLAIQTGRGSGTLVKTSYPLREEQRLYRRRTLIFPTLPLTLLSCKYDEFVMPACQKCHHCRGLRILAPL